MVEGRVREGLRGCGEVVRDKGREGGYWMRYPEHSETYTLHSTSRGT